MLIFIHLIQSILFDNPFVADNQNLYDTKLRALVFDLAMVGALIMVSGIKTKNAR
jgi:hypothetical protein